MNLYADDDCVANILVQTLRRAGHDVRLPVDVGLAGESDAKHLRQAIHEARVFLTRNYDDFEDLHRLLMEGQGHHPGILVIRKDNDPRRNLKPHDVVRALANLSAAGFALPDQYVILNHWR
jgi:hypothetical protein